MNELPQVSAEVLARFDVPGPRYTSYPTVPVWSTDFGPAHHEAALARAGRDPERPLSIYVHLPFCREMCSYCGCNVIIAKDQTVADRYLDSLGQEIALVTTKLGARKRAARLHLGGGTPTFLDERQLERLWRMLSDKFAFDADAEIAVEVDPDVTRASQLKLLRDFGWNRLSMGVQDFDPDVQRAVCRIQTVEQTREVLELARGLGYRSVNFDMIYGLPLQTPASWTRTVEQVVALDPDRIAAYSFAYVPEVKPHQRRLPVAGLPQPADKLELFRIAWSRLVTAGYRPVGMDHFARHDDELGRAADEGRVWRDFQGYTPKGPSDTIAFGVTGISDVGGAFAQGPKSLAPYARAVAEGRLPTVRGHLRSADDDRRRDVITRLMCNFRVTLPGGAAAWAPELARLAAPVADGLCSVDGDTVTLTGLGRIFVRNVAMAFDAYLDAGERRFSRTV